MLAKSYRKKKDQKPLLESESEPSFVDTVYRILSNPVSESEKSESEEEVINLNQKVKNRKNEQLKTFFCFEHI